MILRSAFSFCVKCEAYHGRPILRALHTTRAEYSPNFVLHFATPSLHDYYAPFVWSLSPLDFRGQIVRPIYGFRAPTRFLELFETIRRDSTAVYCACARAAITIEFEVFKTKNKNKKGTFLRSFKYPSFVSVTVEYQTAHPELRREITL